LRRDGSPIAPGQVDTATARNRRLEKPARRIHWLRDLLVRALFGEGYGCDFEGREESGFFGVKELGRDDLIELVKRQLKVSSLQIFTDRCSLSHVFLRNM